MIKRPSDVDDFDDIVEQIDFATPYRRPRPEPLAVIDDEPLRDDILFRLFLARQLAILKSQGHELRTRT